MAIRDRVTVKTKDGTVTGTVVKRMGGSISVSWPSKNDLWLRVSVLDKNGDETGEEVRVPADQLVYVVQDKEPQGEKKKR
jgi:hypothetical protein